MRFTPGGIRAGAAGHDVVFIHPKVGLVLLLLLLLHGECVYVALSLSFIFSCSAFIYLCVLCIAGK
jgi:hypothetical protein